MTALADFVFGVTTSDATIVTLIVGARLLIPLLIPRLPLAIVVVMLIDAADQTILATYTSVDTSETGAYQSVDKALDIYYLAIAYLATMRNWTSDAAFRTSQFLFYWRLIGVVAFELTGVRAVLLIFPNTFEYFFIVYELIRTRFDPSRISARFWVLMAAGIWIFIKLPQEYWIHIAKLDFTDMLHDHAWFAALVVIALVAAALILFLVVIPRLPAPDWGWRFGADRLPSSLREAHARYARRLASGRTLTREAVELVFLLGLVCVIFVTILPGVDLTPVQVMIGVAAIVLADSAISLGAARRGGFGPTTAAGRYVALLATNLVLIYAGHLILSSRREFDLGYGLFFALLITTVIWLYSAFRPVYDLRFAGDSPLHVTSIGDLARRVRAREA